MFDLEDRYWWFLGKRALVTMLLETHVPLPPSLAVDVGCGTGGILATLARRGGTWVGTDRSTLALGFCRARRLTKLFQSSAEAIPLASGSADLVLLLDVLYHRDVQNDRAALAECFRVLASKGTALITDSALNWLRGPHDEAVHTRRRYALGEFVAMIEAAGFEVVRRTYANSLIFPMTVTHRLLRRLTPPRTDHATSDIVLLPRWASAALSAVQALERALLRSVSLPIGTTVVVVARKP